MPQTFELRRLMPLLPLLLTISLNACATAAGCSSLHVSPYSAALNHHLADELHASTPQDVWPTVIIDYARLRDEVRACQGAATP
jgi:hypothetical protein